MKDINSLLEKACIEYCEQVDSVYNEKDVFKAGANLILSKWQEAERWRKASEELPEIDDYLQHSVIAYLVKLDSGAYELAVYHAGGMWLESGTEYELEVTEWKPIT